MSSLEGVFESSEDNKVNVLLMCLMEESQQEEEYYGDDRLVSMIQSLEAEIMMNEMGHVDGQDCSTKPDDWVDMELISSLPFDEMNGWIPCGDDDEMMDHTVAMEYEADDDFQISYGLFFEQQYRETYLSQSDAVFSN
ncbi:hypothetical protein RJT34_29372 [Clitoria ternatea]|uniref:Uncharacterized protein n=1 Tax=Clitoria ternatea TaxID=43366 RepID=A0AAN9FC36_CLITE